MSRAKCCYLYVLPLIHCDVDVLGVNVPCTRSQGTNRISLKSLCHPVLFVFVCVFFLVGFKSLSISLLLHKHHIRLYASWYFVVMIIASTVKIDVLFCVLFHFT